MTIAKLNDDHNDPVDFNSQAEYTLWLRSITPERYESYRDDDRRDAWEGDDDWADDFGYTDESDWDDYAEYLDSLEDDDHVA